jgi:hypothetical protein
LYETGCANSKTRHYQNDLSSSEQGTGLSDAELLRRAVTYSRPRGFKVIERWRELASLFGVGETVGRSLCKRFGVDPDELVAQ